APRGDLDRGRPRRRAQQRPAQAHDQDAAGRADRGEPLRGPRPRAGQGGAQARRPRDRAQHRGLRRGAGGEGPGRVPSEGRGRGAAGGEAGPGCQRRARAHLRERGADRRSARDRRAEHRPQHRGPGGPRGDGAGRAGDGRGHPPTLAAPAARWFDHRKQSPYPADPDMLEAFGRSDVGRRRKLNEDNFLVAPEPSLYAVCDGMGGHNAGEVASQMAIETIASFIERSHKEKEITWPYGLDVNLSYDGNRVKTAIKLANKKVFRAADNREEYTGMGTTVVAA